jgi:hypothetical protein
MSHQQLARRIARLEKRLGPIVAAAEVDADWAGPTWTELAQALAEVGVDFARIVREGMAQLGPGGLRASRDFFIMLREMLQPYPQGRQPVIEWTERLVAYNEQRRALREQKNPS